MKLEKDLVMVGPYPTCLSQLWDYTSWTHQMANNFLKILTWGYFCIIFVIIIIELRERESKTLIDCLTGNQTHNLGLCPEQEWNLWLFHVWDAAPTNWSTQPGQVVPSFDDIPLQLPFILQGFFFLQSSNLGSHVSILGSSDFLPIKTKRKKREINVPFLIMQSLSEKKKCFHWLQFENN